MAWIPVPETHKTATQFIEEWKGLTRLYREDKILNAFREGHVPSYMRTFEPIHLSFVDKIGTVHSLTIFTFPDYLTLGTDEDKLIVPMWPLTAQKLADDWGCVLPTTKLVTLFWNVAPGKIPPQPWGPPYDHSMMSTERFVAHNTRVFNTMSKLKIDHGKIVAGHKKDVVITNKLVAKPKQVAIFGWHRSSGKPIQPLYLGHENTYSDYSHGIRLTSRECVLDGATDDLARIMQDPELHVVVSSEGLMKITRQP